MGYSPVSLANMALALFGGLPIQSFQDATPAGANVALLYPPIVRGLFAEYPWNFAKQTVALNPLNVAELSDGLLPSGWQYAFALPANLIGLPERMLANNRYPDGPETRFEIQGQIVYSNQIALWCVGDYYVDELAWPDYFTLAVVKCLAAELYPVISGNGGRLADLREQAWGTPQEQRSGGALGAAKRADARAQPSRVLAHNPLIDVRMSTISVTGALLP